MMDEIHFPETLPQFQKAFPDEAACANYLEKLRWPIGFAVQNVVLSKSHIDLKNAQRFCDAEIVK